MKEPCMCGAPDCPRCFPHSYKEYLMREKFQELKEEFPELTWEKFVADEEDKEIDRKLEEWERRHTNYYG